MNISEKFCPVCKRKNQWEATVCRHCGAALEDPFADSGASTKTTDMQALVPDRTKDWPINTAAIPENGIAVYVEGSFNPVYLDSRSEVVIGRKVGTTSGAFLDLAPQGGYHLGVSRRHVVVRRTAQGYEVMDLGSVNGTWLNEERLEPQRAYPLLSGSQVRLGRMRVLVLFRPVA